MSGTLAETSSPLLVELHAALSELDRRVRGIRFDELEQRVRTVGDRLAPLSGAEGPLARNLEALREQLDTLPEAPRRHAWLEFRMRVQPAYEAVVHELLRERVSVPSLRPTNYARNALHLASSMFGLAVIELSPSPKWPIAIALSFAVSGWSLELGRVRSARINALCMRLFGRTAHPHEAHRVNSATWYATALVALAVLAAVPAAAVALLVLGLADPAAAIVGRRFGRTRLLHGRTLEGTLGFVVVGAAAAAAFLALAHADLGLGRTAAMAVAGAVAGAVAELSSRRLDDNLTIPLAAGAAAQLVLLV